MITYQGQRVVVTSDIFEGSKIICIAIDAILALRYTDSELTCVPWKDIGNDNAGVIDISQKHYRSVVRWRDRGDWITLYQTRGGEYRFGFVSKAVLGLSPEDELWISNWVDGTNYEHDKIMAQRQEAEKAAQSKPKPKLKAKDRRRLARSQTGNGTPFPD